MNMKRQEVAAELAGSGYRPFMETRVGARINAEAWTNRGDSKTTVIVLYHTETNDVVDLKNLAIEEENYPEIRAFLDDFGNSVFQPQ